jgi:hypothetical protein
MSHQPACPLLRKSICFSSANLNQTGQLDKRKMNKAVPKVRSFIPTELLDCKKLKKHNFTLIPLPKRFIFGVPI